MESDPTGVLIAARSDASHALVDVRVLAPRLREDPAFMRRLGHDMDILREVRHTNLVSVMSFDKRVGAVVYEAVPGSTLSQLLTGQGPLELAAGLVLFEDTIAGLEALHKAGVVHGNLTADSVVVETTGAVLLRDAGTAAPHSGAGLLPEQQADIAPEVLAGASPTAASDLYAATAVFVQSLGGRASKVAMRTDLRPLLNEGMAKNAAERSATFGAFRHELDDYARATFGETWRKDGRALLTAAAAAQASRAIRLSSPSDSPTEGSDAAVAAVAVLRSPAPPNPRFAWGVGMLGFAVLLVAVVLLRGLSAGESPVAAFYTNPFNGLPVVGPTGSPSPTSGAAGPASSPGTLAPGTTVPQPIDPTSTPHPTTDPTGDPQPTPTPNPRLISQKITWTSQSPSGSTYGGSYQATALGGSSGNPVVFNSLNTLVCSTGGGGTFHFVGVGTCLIQASQAGNSQYNPTAATMSFLVVKAPQTITFTSSPSNPTYNGGYTVTAAAAGGAVTFSADPSSVACNVSPSGAVQFTTAGECIIDADQGGDADYTAAATAQQPFRVAQASQSITFTSSAPTCPCSPGQQYTVTATGGGSGNPVTFNIDPSSTPGSCTIAGSTVILAGGTSGTCIIDAFQAGNSNYSAAPEEEQTIDVS